jgi:LPS-assembly protein
VGTGGSGLLAAGVDPLFDLRPAPVVAFAQGSAGARVVLGAATLGYDATVPARPAVVGNCAGTGQRTVSALHVQQQTASFVWDSPCRCFRVAASFGVNDCGVYSYAASLELSRASAAVR